MNLFKVIEPLRMKNLALGMFIAVIATACNDDSEVPSDNSVVKDDSTIEAEKPDESLNGVKDDTDDNTPKSYPEDINADIQVDTLELNSFLKYGPLDIIDYIRIPHYDSQSNTEMRYYGRSCKEGNGSLYNESSGITKADFYCDESFIDGAPVEDIQTSGSFVAFGENLYSHADLMKDNVTNSTITYEMSDLNQANTAKLTTHYTPFDLSGHSVEDSLNAVANNQGIKTFLYDLNHPQSLPSDASFPKGSLCFIPTYRLASMPLFTYVLQNPMAQPIPQNFEEWKDSIVSKSGPTLMSVTSKVGSNNSYVALRLVYNQDNGQTTSYSALGKQDEVIYPNAEFVTTERRYLDNNLDQTSGIVDCKLVNDVAADHIERLIVKYR